MEDERSGEDEFFSPECAKMEAWLDEHPEFSREYFIRKAPRDVIDSWLVAHSIASSSCSSSSQVGGGGNGPAAAGAQHHHLPHGNVLSLVAATGTIALTNSGNDTSLGIYYRVVDVINYWN
ncbi:cGMP-specific 3',5'-cyclic phosphodiesterase [Folsomia candida]|uniref:cGMP-specific 3',5'-cyclic phosphodiesterase n=1 Tax=Folsomia candida TaxID=158441 RepID=A0A226EVA6_FOLCA|nr:cGMP-specific 3',5'-cyclic phosphodiesterase [Folsomia candida]